MVVFAVAPSSVVGAGCGPSETHNASTPHARPGPAPDRPEAPPERPATSEKAPTPAEIDALLGDPRLHQGRIPEDVDRALAGVPGPSEDEEHASRPNPQRKAFGTEVFEALASGDDEGDALIIGLTPLGNSSLRRACPDARVDERGLRARLAHCHEAFDWNEVLEATVNGGESTDGTPIGCTGDVVSLSRVRIQVKTAKGRFDAELRDPVGRDGEILGFLGALTCVDRS